ncbi:MAG: TonB-dependent receptor plug domain-containing protein [Verrucomicrobiota bacterium]
MKTVLRIGVLAPFALIYSSLLFGQAAPAPSPTASASATTDEAVVLSPFEVAAGTDEGYAARETLAGTRFKSELKDVPSQVSIMTKEFLQDIASVNIEDAYRYSINVENTMEYTSATNGGGDFNTGVLNTRSANRIRGLTAPGVTHDFFQTNLLQDAYNTERISYSSGPNAILFGNGNPGGIVDTSFLRANIQRPRYELSVRTDNYGSLRGSVDLNQPIVKNVAALRFAAVNSHQNSWREPGGRREDRYYGTFTLKPTKTTIIRAYYEDAMIDMTTPRNTRFGDQVTPWIQAGRPVFDNGLTNPTLLGTANQGIFNRNVSTRTLLIIGAADPSTPYTTWGSAAAANIALPTTRYSANTIGPGSTPNQTGTDSYIYSLPYDESISPFDVSVNGNGTRNLMYGKIWGASFEQRLPGDVYFQLDHNRERIRNPISDFLRGIGSAVRADANKYLPDRVTPNPNLGRYYVEGEPRVFGFRSDGEETRAMLSYELDLTKNSNLTKWLGRHRAAAMYQRSEQMGQQQETVQRVLPPGTTQQAALDGFGGAPFNTFAFRAYLSDPTNSSTGSTYHITLPFDPVRTTTYTLPDGGTYVAGYKNPYGGSGSANMVNNLSEGKVLAVQNFFLKNRLVTSFGWREDRIRQATYVTQRKSAAAAAAFESIFELDAPTNWSVYTKGNTNTQGAVLHVLSWASVFYNQSSTWNPPTGLINPDDGTQIPGATGEGKDYGIMLRLLDNRISLRLNKYENTSGPAGIEGYRNAIVPVVQNIEQTLIDRTEDGTVNVARPRFYDAEQGTYTLSGLHGDLVSEGYEAEIVANPTRNWRLSIGGARSKSTASNIGSAWVRFIQERAPIWAANSTLLGPGGANQTLGSRYLAIIQTLNQMKQADGQRVENGRDWRVNIVTRYSFTEGMLRGSFVGTGYRFRSPQVLGYIAQPVPNEFPLPGAPATVLVPARDAPVEGKRISETELFLGYSRRIMNRYNWRVQLNIRNLLDDDSPMEQRSAIVGGFPTIYAVPEPRSFILTNTISF